MAKRKSLEIQKSEARAVLEAIAKSRGFTFDELAQLATKEAKKASASRYRHPDNPILTWSGRGRKPKWFDDYVRAGNDPGYLRSESKLSRELHAGSIRTSRPRYCDIIAIDSFMTAQASDRKGTAFTATQAPGYLRL